MAALIGKDGIHHVAGLCELCGEPADPSAEELNALTCTFAQCNASIYHQDCLEKYLKRSGCEKCVYIFPFTANCAMLFHGIVLCKFVFPRSRRVSFQLANACRNRKTGFPCPRGRGKAKGGDQCPGRVRFTASTYEECASRTQPLLCLAD